MLAVLQCPICRQVPAFYAASRTTTKRGVRCAFLIGCSHTRALLGISICEAPDAEAVVARWNAEAERIMTTYTATWTDAQRTRFRAAMYFPAVPDSQLSTLNSQLLNA